jgi:autotransporter-associated beta strand protein
LAGVASSTVTLGNKTLIAGGDDTSTTFAGAASGTGGLTKQGVGTLTLTGPNTYSGATTISAGTLAIGNGGTGGSLAGNSAISNSSALIFNRSDSISQGSNFGSISGSGSVTQNGAGVLTITASNTYSGITTVNSGTLLANNTTGSATGTGAVSIGATGALGGTGTLSPTGSNGIAIAGFLTPGAPAVNSGVGTLGLSTVDGNVTFASTSTADFQLLTNGTHGYSVTYDSAGFIDTITGTYVNGGNDRLLFNSTGAGGIDFSALVANSLSVTFASGYTPAFHDIFDLVDWSSLVGGLNSTQLSLPSLASYDSTWSWDTTKFASHGIVGIVAVPEPGRVLLLLLGLFGMLMRRRRC